MNIYKIIFKQNNKSFEVNKTYYYKYETKYIGKNLIYQKRFKKYYSHYVTNLKDGRQPDYMSNKTIYDLLTRHTNNYYYDCYDHNNNLINKDLDFYKYITIKDMKLNKGIKNISLASDVINELSMALLIK
tara:strand:+ start:612 stop:1001 length:390 start_codon:yes stop_codon:yes gene_type:complete